MATERVLEMELRPAVRLTGRDLLRMIDRRRREELARGTWALGYPAPGWRNDPRYR